MTGSIVRRILTFCLLVFVLAGLLGEASPVQAGGKADDSDGSLDVMVKFLTPVKNIVCLKQKINFEFYMVRFPLGGGDYPLSRLDMGGEFGYPHAQVQAKLGKVSPPKQIFPWHPDGIMYTGSFIYTASKEGSEMITVAGFFPNAENKDTMEFQVVNCKYKVKGTADTGRTVPHWKSTGTYQITGTVKVDDSGNITGEGKAELYNTQTFTGGDIEGTCWEEHPFEGQTSLEVNGDKLALEEEGNLKFTVHLSPMQFGAYSVKCKAPNGGGYGTAPASATPSFEIDLQTVPAEGGSFMMPFKLPTGNTLSMYVTIDPGY
jgi:hypothetical protein